MSHNVILIPSYNPSETLLELVKKLQAGSDLQIYIFNDGSLPQSQEIFEKCRALNVTVVDRQNNLGKGVTLKHGISYILENVAECKGILTCDDDLQHTPPDILKILKYADEMNSSFILGSRSFDRETPIKSRFGNRVTAFLINFLFNSNIVDSQSGLRYFSREALQFILKTSGERFDFETICLLEWLKNDQEIDFIPIETVYFEKNRGTRFSPLKDSISVISSVFRVRFM